LIICNFVLLTVEIETNVKNSLKSTYILKNARAVYIGTIPKKK